jgi:hypothetical protein
LSKGVVSPRTTQEAMRHSDMNLTMNTHTNPKQLDMVGALESLPALPWRLGAAQFEHGRITISATGTDDSTASPLAPTSAKRGRLQTIVGQIVRQAAEQGDDETANATGLTVQDLRPLPIMDNGRQKERETRVELATSSLGS